MSKVLCLIKHIPKKGSVYLLIDVQEKLDNFTDLISEAITNKKVIIHKEGEVQSKELSIKCPYVNFSGFKNGQRRYARLRNECNGSRNGYHWCKF